MKTATSIKEVEAQIAELVAKKKAIAKAEKAAAKSAAAAARERQRNSVIKMAEAAGLFDLTLTEAEFLSAFKAAAEHARQAAAESETADEHADDSPFA